MKSKITVFLIVLLVLIVAILSQAQTIRIANNNPGAIGGANVYTGSNAISDAIVAASDGDIIYIVPGGTLHPVTTISKEVSVFGVGLDRINATGAQTLCDRFVISADNVRISGINFTTAASFANAILLSGTRTNIMVDNCSFTRFSGEAINGLILQNNIMGENFGGTGAHVIDISTTATGVRIANNIIYGSTQTSSAGWLRDLNGAMVENNIFVGIIGGSAQQVFFNVTNCNIKNNIFYAVQPTNAGLSFINNTFEYNISFNAAVNTFPTTNGNTSSNDLVNVDPLFVNLPVGNSYDFSYDPNLQVGSPGLGSGEAGTDRGVFGGGSPLDLTFTSLPTIQSITIPPTVAQGDDLITNVKGNGN